MNGVVIVSTDMIKWTRSYRPVRHMIQIHEDAASNNNNKKTERQNKNKFCTLSKAFSTTVFIKQKN